MQRDISRYIGGARHSELPADVKTDFKKASFLEWVTVGYLLTVAVVMYLAMGTSAAMKAAWVEDVVSIFPAIAFLVASYFFDRKSNINFPYGYHRAYTAAFITGSVALLVLGLYILINSAISLITQDHPTIGTINLYGHEIWMGWLMILALLYSFLPAIFLGRKKMPLASRMHQKVLHVDSEAQKADWMTACAGMVGIIGIGLGFWWADSVAAVLISLSIVRDGVARTGDSVKDLMDELPRTYDNKAIHPLVSEVVSLCLQQSWIEDVRIRMREHGMVFFGDIFIVPRDERNLTDKIVDLQKRIQELDWKIQDIAITPVKHFEEDT